MKRRGLFLSDLPSAEWIQYVKDLEALYEAAKATVEAQDEPGLAEAVRQVEGS